MNYNGNDLLSGDESEDISPVRGRIAPTDWDETFVETQEDDEAAAVAEAQWQERMTRLNQTSLQDKRDAIRAQNVPDTDRVFLVNVVPDTEDQVTPPSYAGGVPAGGVPAPMCFAGVQIPLNVRVPPTGPPSPTHSPPPKPRHSQFMDKGKGVATGKASAKGKGVANDKEPAVPSAKARVNTWPSVFNPSVCLWPTRK